jgi:cytochrome c-type biogenesis protein
LAGTQDSVWAGVSLLSVYSLGLAIPFLIAALALDWFLGVFSRFRRFLPMVEKTSGVILILLGLLLATGRLRILNSYLTTFTPTWLLERL